MHDKSGEDLTRRVAQRLPRRAMVHGVGIASVAGVLAATAGVAHAASNGPFPSHPKWHFVFVNHVTTNPFFVPTVYGIQDACALFDCTYQWTGSETSDVAQMVNAMNAAIAAKADAIAVSMVDPRGFNAPTVRAMKAGIPVFSYNADVPTGSPNPRLAYIGQDLFQSGLLVGARIVELVDSGLVPIFIATPGQLNIQPRFDGAKAAIVKSGKKIDVAMIATGPTVNEELSKIKAYYLGHQNLKGMFAVDATDTQGVAEVMKLYDLPKKGIRAGGYDLLPKTLQLVNDGYVDFVVDQQPYLQGFYTVMEMFLFKASGGLVGPAEINTGLKFVTKEGVKPYLDTKTRYEGSSSTPMIVPRSGPIG